MTDGLQAAGEKKQQKTVEEIDQEMKRLQEEKVALSAREHMFFPDYERGDLVALHNDIVQFALGNVAGLKLMAALLGSTNSWLGHVATPCTKKTLVYSKSPDVYVYWTSRGGTHECSWRVNTAAKQVVSYTHNMVCRFVDPVKEEPPAPAPQAETVVANLVVAADPPPAPEKAVSFIDTASAAREAGAKYKAEYNDYMAKRRAVPLSRLNDEWRAAVGLSGQQAASGVDIDMGTVRPGAIAEYSSLLTKRPSPWAAIERAVLRNETRVLYCKHKDDGWTDALWTAAVAHLEFNGIRVITVHVMGDGTKYYSLYWDSPQ